MSDQIRERLDEHEASVLFPPPLDYEAGLTYPHEALRDHKRAAFIAGAAWQREQLLTDETVERAAMAILLRNYPACTLDEARWFAGASGVDDARNKARTALIAAIGDQE